jgi:hypothetical protein
MLYNRRQQATCASATSRLFTFAFMFLGTLGACSSLDDTMVIQVVSNVMDFDAELVQAAGKRNKSATKILRQLDNLAAALSKMVMMIRTNLFCYFKGTNFRGYLFSTGIYFCKKLGFAVLIFVTVKYFGTCSLFLSFRALFNIFWMKFCTTFWVKYNISRVFIFVTGEKL